MSVSAAQTPPQFRSPLRKKLPGKPSNYFAWLLARSALVNLVVLAMCMFALLLALRAFPRTGGGYLIYWLYDNIYLVIRGYAYIWHFPMSLIWWAVFLTLAIPRIVGFVFQVSLTRTRYMGLAQRVIRTRYRTCLVKWSRAIRGFDIARRRRIQPTLLLEFVWRERARALNRLSVEPSPIVANEVQKLTALWVDLYIPSRPTHFDHLTVALRCVESLTQIQIYLGDSLVDEMVAELVTRIKTAATQLSLHPLIKLKDAEEARESNFGLSAIAGDLLLLGGLANASREPEEIRMLAYSMNESIEGRKRWLVRACREIQPLQRGRIGKPNPKPESLTDDLIDISYLPLIGSLTMWIALGLAVRVNAPGFALAYVELVEALHVTLGTASNKPPEKVAALIQDIPRSDHYRVCEILAERFSHARARAWSETFSPSQTVRTRAIQDSALAMYNDEVAGLGQAAGPMPVPYSPSKNKGPR